MGEYIDTTNRYTGLTGVECELWRAVYRSNVRAIKKLLTFRRNKISDIVLCDMLEYLGAPVMPYGPYFEKYAWSRKNKPMRGIANRECTRRRYKNQNHICRLIYDNIADKDSNLFISKDKTNPYIEVLITWAIAYGHIDVIVRWLEAFGEDEDSMKHYPYITLPDGIMFWKYRYELKVLDFLKMMDDPDINMHLKLMEI